jgi:plasmid maintenance system antidote protein VapI
MKARLPENEPQTVSEFLRPLMAACDLTTSALARVTDIDNSYLHRVLDANHPISIEMSLRVAKVLGIDEYAIATVQVRRQIYEYVKTAAKDRLSITGGQRAEAKVSRPARSRRRLLTPPAVRRVSP